jgi:uncharacterized protein YbbK (DUF523 family)
MYIVSACLLGANCKYNGGNNDNEAVKDFCEGHKVLVVCPETAGGLKSPRPPAEQVRASASCESGAESINSREGGNAEDFDMIRIINKNGEDVTEYFKRGAGICLEKVLAACSDPDREDYEEPELAILKANSPSCGCGKIYDGTFSGKLVDGDGVFARMLKEQGIKVITEEDIEKRQRG